MCERAEETGGEGGKAETLLGFIFNFLKSCFFHPGHALANEDAHPSYSTHGPSPGERAGHLDLLAFTDNLQPLPSRKPGPWPSPCENFLPTNSIFFSTNQERMLGFKREQCYNRDNLERTFKTGIFGNKATITQSGS